MKNDPNPEAAGAPPASDPLYLAVVEQHAEGVFARARETLATGGSIDEPGLLRLVLAHLLTNEREPSRLAARAADLANAVARLVTIQRQGGEYRREGLQDAMAEVRDEIDANRDGVARPKPSADTSEGALR